MTSGSGDLGYTATTTVIALKISFFAVMGSNRCIQGNIILQKKTEDRQNNFKRENVGG